MTNLNDNPMPYPPRRARQERATLHAQYHQLCQQIDNLKEARLLLQDTPTDTPERLHHWIAANHAINTLLNLLTRQWAQL